MSAHPHRRRGAEIPVGRLDRRRASRGHGKPHRLHEADTDLDLQNAAPRRQTGRTGMKDARNEDFVEHLFLASDPAYILIFTPRPRLLAPRFNEIPDVGGSRQGKHVGNLGSATTGRNCTYTARRPRSRRTKQIHLLCDAQRYGEEDRPQRLLHVMSRGIIAITSRRRRMISRPPHPTASSGLPGSMMGKPFASTKTDVRSMGRNATGVRGMRLDDKDYIVGMATTVHRDRSPPVKPRRQRRAGEPEIGEGDRSGEKRSLFLSVTENGYGQNGLPPKNTACRPARLGRHQRKDTERNAKSPASRRSQEDFRSYAHLAVWERSFAWDSSTIRESDGRRRECATAPRTGRRVAAAVVIAPDEEQATSLHQLLDQAPWLGSSSGAITTAAATRSPGSRCSSRTPCADRPDSRMVLESMRMIFPYCEMSITSESSVTCAMLETLPLRSVVFTLMTPEPPRPAGGILRRSPFAVAVFSAERMSDPFFTRSITIANFRSARLWRSWIYRRARSRLHRRRHADDVVLVVQTHARTPVALRPMERTSFFVEANGLPINGGQEDQLLASGEADGKSVRRLSRCDGNDCRAKITWQSL